jgi:UDP-N-acetylglucosamine--N-acetylmuramyl-(pentapeptide) pyrophosphoryl-undecaprenol N-acetylglucosamine transferase
MNVVVTGGGTAGHVFPALATARALRDRHGATVLFIGADDGQEAILVPDAGFPFMGLRVGAAQSRFSLHTVRAIALAFRGARRVRSRVRGADVVVSIGGFASAPAVLAARRTRRPLVLIEPNTVPGVVNRIAARWA